MEPEQRRTAPPLELRVSKNATYFGFYGTVFQNSSRMELFWLHFFSQCIAILVWANVLADLYNTSPFPVHFVIDNSIVFVKGVLHNCIVGVGSPTLGVRWIVSSTSASSANTCFSAINCRLQHKSCASCLGLTPTYGIIGIRSPNP